MHVISFCAGAVVMSLIIGNMSAIIASTNPGVTAMEERKGLVAGFCHDRPEINKILGRSIRGHISQYLESRGTAIDFKEVFQVLPERLQEELAVALK
jgi:hypothetical protein